MKDNKDTSIDGSELRRRAEEKLKETAGEAHPAAAEEDNLRLIHELRVHQIELEMQNDELRQSRENAEASLELYTNLYDFAPVSYFTISNESIIRQMNLTGASLLGIERSRLVNRRFGLFVSRQTRVEFNAFLERVFQSKAKQACEVELKTAAGAELYVHIEAAPPRDAKECRISVTDITQRKQLEKALAQASERDHHIADVLQQGIIPPPIPTIPENYEIAARYQPALSEAEVCGDFYDLIDLGEGKLGIVIGDVVGKGLSASTRVAGVTHTLRSYAFIDTHPSNIMTLLHNAIFKDTSRENDMLTLFLAVLDMHTGEVAYTNAGHEPPLLMHSDGQTQYLTTGGPMLIGEHEEVYEEGQLTLQSGDVLVMVTDGITESRKVGKSELFGAEGIISCLSRNADASAEEIASKLLEDAMSFAGGTPRDDVAIVVIKKIG